MADNDGFMDSEQPYQSDVEDDTISLEDRKENDAGEDQASLELHPIIAQVKADFAHAKDGRRFDEDRWGRAYRNYRGVYDSSVVFREEEQCRVFVKITKTKVLAAYSQLVEVLFGGQTNGVPISVSPTSVPEGIVDEAHLSGQSVKPQGSEAVENGPSSMVGYSGDGADLEPGATLTERVGNYLKSKFKDAEFKAGRSMLKGDLNVNPAKESAERMQRVIKDQLEESNVEAHLRLAAFEMCLLGSGCIKGPFVEKKEYPKWENGEYKPVVKNVPRIEQRTIWDIYPDPDAVSPLNQNFVIERHCKSRMQMRQLAKRPHFRANVIEDVIATGPNYVREHWESEIRDSAVDTAELERWEVLEYWGYMDRAHLEEELEVDELKELPDSVKEVAVNVFVCKDKILRLVVNPFVPARIPYLIIPYELNPYNNFGIGLAENMEDLQELMNGFTRMAVDNAALAGHMMVEVDETYLVPGQSMKVEPGKVWRREGGPPGQAIFGTKWPSTMNENMQMFDRARQMADEATGIPSFSHGQTGVQGTGRTAAGISMLMGAASGNIKTVVKNVDDFLLRPLGKALFAFNMQFNQDVKDIQGDLEIKAHGVQSLMQKEVKSQRMLTFLQVVANPAFAPYANIHNILEKVAETLDIDPNEVLNDPVQQEIAAKLLGTSGAGAAAAQPQQQGAPSNAGQQPQQPGRSEGAGANATDPTGAGNGTINAGNAPMPGGAGFTGNQEQ